MNAARVVHPLPPANFEDVRVFDSPERMWVRSRRGSKEYLVDLNGYGFNGVCSCPDFKNHFEKYLSRGFSAEQVWESGVLTPPTEEPTLRPYQLGVNDALRCFHICRAISFHSAAYARATHAAKEAQAARPGRPA